MLSDSSVMIVSCHLGREGRCRDTARGGDDQPLALALALLRGGHVNR
jgi:hypothetical protein